MSTKVIIAILTLFATLFAFVSYPSDFSQLRRLLQKSGNTTNCTFQSTTAYNDSYNSSCQTFIVNCNPTCQNSNAFVNTSNSTTSLALNDESFNVVDEIGSFNTTSTLNTVFCNLTSGSAQQCFNFSSIVNTTNTTMNVNCSNQNSSYCSCLKSTQECQSIGQRSSCSITQSYILNSTSNTTICNITGSQIGTNNNSTNSSCGTQMKSCFQISSNTDNYCQTSFYAQLQAFTNIHVNCTTSSNQNPNITNYTNITSCMNYTTYCSQTLLDVGSKQVCYTINTTLNTSSIVIGSSGNSSTITTGSTVNAKGMKIAAKCQYFSNQLNKFTAAQVSACPSSSTNTTQSTNGTKAFNSTKLQSSNNVSRTFKCQYSTNQVIVQKSWVKHWCGGCLNAQFRVQQLFQVRKQACTNSTTTVTRSQKVCDAAYYNYNRGIIAQNDIC